MGQLWKYFQEYSDKQPFPPSVRQFALKLGMSATAFSNWQHDLSRIPQRRNLIRFSDLTGVPYNFVVNAAMHDAKYLPEKEARAADAWADGHMSGGDGDADADARGSAPIDKDYPHLVDEAAYDPEDE